MSNFLGYAGRWQLRRQRDYAVSMSYTDATSYHHHCYIRYYDGAPGIGLDILMTPDELAVGTRMLELFAPLPDGKAFRKGA